MNGQPDEYLKLFFSPADFEELWSFINTMPYTTALSGFAMTEHDKEASVSACQSASCWVAWHTASCFQLSVLGAWWHCQSASIWSVKQRASTFSSLFNMLVRLLLLSRNAAQLDWTFRTAHQPAHPPSCGSCCWAQASMLAMPVRVNMVSAVTSAAPAPPVTNAALAPAVTSAVHVRRVTVAAPAFNAASTSVPIPMFVAGSPLVRRHAAAGVACNCLLPSTEVRTWARSDSFAIPVATFLPASCSCVAVERPPGPRLGFRCHALARSRSRLATLKASPPWRPHTPCLSGLCYESS